jgi:hypothetical protein
VRHLQLVIYSILQWIRPHQWAFDGYSDIKGEKHMYKPFIIMTKGLMWFFILSHISGWMIAWLQTIWIVKEIKKKKSLV